MHWEYGKLYNYVEKEYRNLFNTFLLKAERQHLHFYEDDLYNNTFIATY